MSNGKKFQRVKATIRARKIRKNKRKGTEKAGMETSVAAMDQETKTLGNLN